MDRKHAGLRADRSEEEKKKKTTAIPQNLWRVSVKYYFSQDTWQSESLLVVFSRCHSSYTTIYQKEIFFFVQFTLVTSSLLSLKQMDAEFGKITFLNLLNLT